MTSPSELLQRFVEDSAALNPAELDQLVTLLRESPARAVQLREQLMLDDLLAQKLTVDRRNFLAQVEQRIADFERGENEIDNQVADLRAMAEAELERPSAPPRQSPWLWIAVVVAASVLVAGLFLAPLWLNPNDKFLASVVRVDGEVVVGSGDRSAPLTAADALVSGQPIRVAEGATLTWEYPDKTTVVVSGGEVVLRSNPESGAKEVRIERGEVFASVAKQHRGPMVFDSPHARAIVRGTELRLLVERHATRLDVTEGQVEFVRVGSGEPILVQTNQSSKASGNRLSLDTLAWPEERDAVAFLFPYERGNGRSVARNPASGRFRDTPLEPHGTARVDEHTRLAVDGGGWFATDDRGNDIASLCKRTGEFSLETVVEPRGHADEGVIVSLANGEGKASFQLIQHETGVAFRLRSSEATAGLQELRLGDIRPKRHVHVTVTYRDGLLCGYLDGREAARLADVRGLLDNWTEGPLSIGADATGANGWRGAVSVLAIHDRELTAANVERHVRSYQTVFGTIGNGGLGR